MMSLTLLYTVLCSSKGGVDLAFMVDASSNIKDTFTFELMMRFVRSVFHSFTWNRGVRYGLLVYGNSVKVIVIDL